MRSNGRTNKYDEVKKMSLKSSRSLTVILFYINWTLRNIEINIHMFYTIIQNIMEIVEVINDLTYHCLMVEIKEKSFFYTLIFWRIMLTTNETDFCLQKDSYFYAKYPPTSYL